MSDAGARSGPVIGVGEILLRLTPPNGRLIAQAQSMAVEVGGAEANVLAGLTSLGHPTALVSRVPDNPLGAMACGTLAGVGIDVSRVARAGGRMGLYFLEPGRSARAASITYDRAGSTFADAKVEDFDFAAALQGASLLHLSGITPALGPQGSKIALAAASAARKAGVPVSFDGNFRERLWAAWDSNPREILTELIGHAQILFGNHRDITLLSGKTFSADGETRRVEAAQAAFEMFPNLELISSTARTPIDSDSNRIAARADTRTDSYQTEEVLVAGIVDRIGTGDGFAAGVLDGWLRGGDCQEMAETGLAMGVLKHAIVGDMPLISRDCLDAYRAGEIDVRR